MPPRPLINNFQVDKEEENPFKPACSDDLDRKLKELQKGHDDQLQKKANDILIKLEGQYCSFK